MNHCKKQFYWLLGPAALLLAFCSSAAAQSQATITITNTTCSNNSGCSVKFTWNDPSNPNPSDTLVGMSQGNGEFFWDSANSGSAEFSYLFPAYSPFAAVLKDSNGNWLTEIWCYVEGPQGGYSIQCE